VETESFYKTVILMKVSLFAVTTGLNIYFILITMAHNDRSIREGVIALAEKGRLFASTAGNSTVFPCPLQQNGYEIPEGSASWKA